MNQNNMTSGVEDFENRLNLSAFTNITKGYTTEEFDRTFNKSEYLVFEESSIQAFIKGVHDEIGGDIIEGGFNDTIEVKELMNKATEDIKSLEKVRINDGDDMLRYVYVKKVDDAIEKSHVTEAFAYGQNAIKFSKKGSELKEKVVSEKARIERELEEGADKIDAALECCRQRPTEKPDLHGPQEIVETQYKVFNWNQTYYSQPGNDEESCQSAVGAGGVDCQPCSSAEEAECNSKYNSLVYEWIENCAEKCTLGLYDKHIEDNKNYELTAEQMLALKF